MAGLLLVSTLTELPGLPPAFACLPSLPSKPCLPQIPKCCHPNSSLTLSVPQCRGLQILGTLVKSSFPQAGQGRDLMQMGQDTHPQLGLRWGAGSGQTGEAANVALGAVWGDLSSVVLPPLTPPPHRLHPFTVGQGARSGQRRPLSLGLEQATLCPLLQPQLPPPHGQSPEGREVGRGLEGALRGLP